MTQNTINEQLWDEARRLTVEIEELQSRLDYLLECEAEEEPENWNVWPYSWAIAGWNQALSCFHSFHQNRSEVGEPSFDTARPLHLV